MTFRFLHGSYIFLPRPHPQEHIPGHFLSRMVFARVLNPRTACIPQGRFVRPAMFLGIFK